ncbi:hypothetical protein L6452_40561 [Arctium lappa]|uniref:Uncharacterized protein n=1 Tax=Arctium lappa TaxID=4217 RepID=A0ACB8XM76_ARCLA|nr:hypothetical protein L6452_40561 [Arctium lappa]
MADSNNSESTNLRPEKTPGTGATQSMLSKKRQTAGKSLIQECIDVDQVPREGMVATDLQPPDIEIGNDDTKFKKSRAIRAMDIKLVWRNPTSRVGLGIYLGLKILVLRIRTQMGLQTDLEKILSQLKMRKMDVLGQQQLGHIRCMK